MLVGVAQVPAHSRVYAIGDIHGCLTELTALFALIEADMETATGMDCTVVAVGDYCDRGPDTKGVLDFLIEKTASYKGNSRRKLVCLRGNHDQRFLEFLDLPDQTGEAFLTYGGRQTLASYGIDPDGCKTLAELSGAFARAVPKLHIRFLDALPLMHIEGDFAFVHAGIRPGRALKEQTADDLLWIRNAFLKHESSHSHVIVHGHTIDERFDINTNRINVDTGAFETGILSCAVMEGKTLRKLQTPARRWDT